MTATFDPAAMIADLRRQADTIGRRNRQLQAETRWGLDCPTSGHGVEARSEGAADTPSREVITR